MDSHEQTEVFFHVGLGKVASSYLQQRVFPKLKGVRYVSTHRYKKSPAIIEKSGPGRYLVSREFDRQYEAELRWFASHYPKARVIIILRRHDSWIASQYRRFVKNGHTMDFSEFINLDESKSFWKHEHIRYLWKLELAEELFGSRPLVLFHDDLKKDSWAFLDQMCKFMGAAYDRDSISLSATHSSYSEKQLRILRTLNRKFRKGPPKAYAEKWKHWLFYRPWWLLFHLIMYVGALLPNSWIPKDSLCPKDDLDRIRAAFEDDWQKVLEYVGSR